MSLRSVAVLLLLALLLVVLPTAPASAAICTEVSYAPGWTASNHNYLRGSGYMICTGDETVTDMRLRSVLQVYYVSDGKWHDLWTQTDSGWKEKHTGGIIETITKALYCPHLYSKLTSYRTKLRYSWQSWYGSQVTASLWSGRITVQCQ